MEHESKARLLTLFRAYVTATGKGAATVAQAVANDWRFFDRLEDESKTITLRKHDQIIRNFSSIWPPETPWPADLERPEPQVVGAE